MRFTCYIEKLREEIDSFANTAIAVLLDSKLPGTAGGGTGQSFDWSLASKIDRPVILAGGLNVDNVKEAVNTCHATILGVDVSSGVEIPKFPGIKDKNLIEKFASNIRMS